MINRRDRKGLVAPAIREARGMANKGEGMTQKDAAKKLGVARQTYLDIESGVTLPRVDMLINLAEIFEVPIGHFFGERYRPHFLENDAESIETLLDEVERGLFRLNLRAKTLRERLETEARCIKRAS